MLERDVMFLKNHCTLRKLVPGTTYWVVVYLFVVVVLFCFLVGVFDCLF